MTIECIRFKEYKKGSLLGFADVYIKKWDLELYGLSLFEKEGKKSISFPSREYEKEGEKKKSSYYRMRDANNFKLFCEKIQEAIEKKIFEDLSQGEKPDGTDDSSFYF